jgi:hypothetical protein
MRDIHGIQAAPEKIVVTVAGRQRVGKTALLNSMIQYCQPRGGRLIILNADQQNTTHSLSTFFPDARVPPSGGSLMDNRAWIETEIARIVRGNCHAVLDAGGGWTGFSSLAEEVPLYASLEAVGVRLVGLVCCGTEQADLDYLSRILDNGTFRPDRAAIILNTGLITSGRSPASAFASVLQHDAVVSATAQGARVLIMPALSCMAQVTDRGLSFAEAAEGRVKAGQAPMALFDPVRVREWWTKKMPEFFGKFPPDWLPIDHSLSTRAGKTERVR